MYKKQMQFKAMQQGKDLTGAVALEGARPSATAGMATQATDLIVSAAAQTAE
jgi:hypothetical protein